MKEPEKKVDQSWKEQIERERVHEDVAGQAPPPPSPKPETEPADAVPEGDESVSPGAAQDLGPASLQALVTQLAMQTMFSLGLVQTQDGHEPETDLDQSRYLIDLVGLLEEKTAGNLNEEEQKMLTNTLHDLRMAYLSVSRR